MSTQDRDQESGDRGCLLLVGLLILSISAGTAFGQAIGWLALGVGLIVVALL